MQHDGTIFSRTKQVLAIALSIWAKLSPVMQNDRFWPRRSWQLKLNRALKVSGLIERTWKFAEAAVGCDASSGFGAFLSTKQQKMSLNCHRTITSVHRRPHSSAVTAQCNYGVKGVGK